MKHNIKREPMSAPEGFVVGVSILVIVGNALTGDWGDALDGFAFTFFFWAWSVARRSSDAYEHAFVLARRGRR